MVLERKVARELRRRLRPRPAQADPFVHVHAFARDGISQAAAHPAWELLDRARVDELLAADAMPLDGRSRALVWRLATAFGAAAGQDVNGTAARADGTSHLPA